MAETRRVLVVDDEASFRKVVHASLIGCGFAVEEAGSGEAALEALAQQQFDIVLLDINMPGMGGIEACRQIRKAKPDLGVIVLTVRDAEADVLQAFNAGADDYITKPFRFAELIARLRAVLRRTLPEHAGLTMLRAGDLEIDFDKRLLSRAGEIIHLTPTEFDLLALLMKNSGVLVPHNKLLRTIWGPEYGEEIEYLRTYMRALRKKIEDDPAHPKYILTEPWVGYRFHNPSEQ